MGGAMFGDNLSFISDTTIAAGNGQGSAMKRILGKLLDRISGGGDHTGSDSGSVFSDRDSREIEVDQSYHLLQVLPYVLVLIGGIIVYQCMSVVLLTGIASGALIMLLGGQPHRPICWQIWVPASQVCLRPVSRGDPCCSHVCADPGVWRIWCPCRSAGSTGSLRENVAGSWVWDC